MNIMVSPHEKLAKSLEVLRVLQERGVVAVRSADLTRTHRERLIKNGFLQEVMKGWYIPVHPDEITGESSAWYASFWGFCAGYLKERFGDNWSLSPEQSLLLHAGNMTVPRQLLVRSPKARNKITILPHDTSLVDTRAALPKADQFAEKDGLRMFSVPAGLVSCRSGFFLQNATDARAVLSMMRHASDVLSLLLEGGRTTVAGRLAGAFRNIGRDRIADDIVNAMQTAGYDIREVNPFESTLNLILPTYEQSPYVNRIRLMWQQMREPVLKTFPAGPGRPSDIAAYLKAADDIYVTDAYHSLSIEGYRKDQVFIRQSMHVPPHYEAVRDCMAAFFDLLREEPEPSVRVVLGHFVFVYIHPYMDGNGRIGRFLMNVMLAAGGYSWTVIPLEKRDDHMNALESGSVEQDIEPFAIFLGQLVSN